MSMDFKEDSGRFMREKVENMHFEKHAFWELN